jgi:hypothetical protein
MRWRCPCGTRDCIAFAVGFWTGHIVIAVQALLGDPVNNSVIVETSCTPVTIARSREQWIRITRCNQRSVGTTGIAPGPPPGYRHGKPDYSSTPPRTLTAPMIKPSPPMPFPSPLPSEFDPFEGGDTVESRVVGGAVGDAIGDAVGGVGACVG